MAAGGRRESEGCAFSHLTQLGRGDRCGQTQGHHSLAGALQPSEVPRTDSTPYIRGDSQGSPWTWAASQRPGEASGHKPKCHSERLFNHDEKEDIH